MTDRRNTGLLLRAICLSLFVLFLPVIALGATEAELQHGTWAIVLGCAASTADHFDVNAAGF